MFWFVLIKIFITKMANNLAFWNNCLQKSELQNFQMFS